MTAPQTAQHSPDARPPEHSRHSTRARIVPAPRVFYPAIVIILAIVVVAIAFPTRTGDTLALLQGWVVAGLGPYYLLIVGAFVVFAAWMGMSRFGDIKLGQDDDVPEFGLMSWFSMLFAAGMGIGLVFWGTAEPLTHFTDPKPGVTGSSQDLAAAAMSQTFLHWGFHAWAIYAVVGLSLAYAIHRKGRPVSIRWALEPILGDRVRGRLGDVIDVTAIVGTLFGVATSLGLGVKQIAAGLHHLGVVDKVDNTLLVVLIVVITLIATASVVSGVGKGIKWLSNINLGMAGLLLFAVLILGPTLYLLRVFVESIGGYLQDVVGLTFDAGSFTGQAGLDWQGGWTIFYWGWWISWAPFVGVFIARISRGRTVREFVAGVLLVPTLVTFAWFAVMGGSAIKQAWDGSGGGLFDPAVGIIPENVLFDFLSGLPFGGVLSVIAVIVVAIFFVTSADSGSLVIDMLASGGDTNPPKWSRILWAGLGGLVSIALLLAGGLAALQTGAILTAIPVSVVMIGMCVATYKALQEEHQVLVLAERRQRREELARRIGKHVTAHLEENFDDHFGDQMDERITAALSEGEQRRWKLWRRKHPVEHARAESDDTVQEAQSEQTEAAAAAEEAEAALGAVSETIEALTEQTTAEQTTAGQTTAGQTTAEPAARQTSDVDAVATLDHRGDEARHR
ncbi:BCCT family transporter [Cryobacterium sp. PH31-AA6]|uniref:BCCT family transporter n=1 Tax=Cryobacterium sp. PH31-AA6 TaxID=3046205 RepID=UPI0024BA7E7B|nr:BCCT family transporter [Cryobacterium sp. PH31-AA6]MDJ0322823.1 BCCT family transporter [Cryobacterium sp. PH31-AA6]